LEQVHEEKDIGVIIDDELKFDKHISEKVKKANSTFALIRRIFKHLDERTFITMYKTLVRTHLDYARAVWFPYRKRQFELLEGVQRRTTRQIPGMKNLNYEERLRKLKLPTIKYRRIRGDMIETYKIINEKYDPEASNFIKPRDEHIEREASRGNPKKILVQRPKLNIRRFSFSIRVTHLWNNSFKNRLDKCWQHQDVVYDYTSDIESGGHAQTNRGTNIIHESSEEDL
jgi:hypothetical protein